MVGDEDKYDDVGEGVVLKLFSVGKFIVVNWGYCCVNVMLQCVE